MGRVLNDQRTTNGVTKTTSYTHNLDGTIYTLANPAGRTITYGINVAEQPTQVADDSSVTYAETALYMPWGALSSLINVASSNILSSLYYRALTEFVKANVHRANPFVCFYRPETPDGFDSIVISAESRDRWWGEGGGYSLDDIRPQLAARISGKDKLVPNYRANLPSGAKVWLLLYTGVTVARSMMIPHGIETWKFPFRSDRVFWFTALEGQFAEIQKTQTASAAVGATVT